MQLLRATAPRRWDMDRYGDHALVHPCGGDRIKRRSRLQTVLAARAAAADLSPEVEKAGLLPVRPASARLVPRPRYRTDDPPMITCLIGAYNVGS